MTMLALEKCPNPVQWGYYLVQRCFNLVQWHKRVATVKVRQFIITKHNVTAPLAFVPYLKMATRWIDAKQRTIAERISASLTLGFPMVWVPCPAGASVSVGSNQSLTTISTKPLLSPPCFLSYSLRKGSHGHTSKVTRPKWKPGKNIRYKDGWAKTREGDMVVKEVSGVQLDIYITPPARGENRKTVYNLWVNGKWVGTSKLLSEAKRKAEAYAKRLKRK